MKVLRFLAAITVAILGGVIWWSHPWGRLRDALYLAWDSLREPPAIPEVVEARLAACRACVLYYEPLQTCGTPLHDHDMGCWCHVPAKARIPAAKCWLRQHYGPKAKYGVFSNGWDDNL